MFAGSGGECLQFAMPQRLMSRQGSDKLIEPGIARRPCIACLGDGVAANPGQAHKEWYVTYSCVSTAPSHQMQPAGHTWRSHLDAMACSCCGIAANPRPSGGPTYTTLTLLRQDAGRAAPFHAHGSLPASGCSWKKPGPPNQPPPRPLLPVMHQRRAVAAQAAGAAPAAGPCIAARGARPPHSRSPRRCTAALPLPPTGRCPATTQSALRPHLLPGNHMPRKPRQLLPAWLLPTPLLAATQARSRAVPRPLRIKQGAPRARLLSLYGGGGICPPRPGTRPRS